MEKQWSKWCLPGAGDEIYNESSIATSLGHDLKTLDYRSEDVLLQGEDMDDVDFREFGLSDEIIRGLVHEGFEKPSPIQLRAIPIGITGPDMLMKSKSGTGKSCVFSVIALERVTVTLNKIQALVLVPSREIALQTQRVMNCIGVFKKGLQVEIFIGGCPVTEDLYRMTNCHIAVGTPGRLSHLIRDFEMDLSTVQVFVMDEADKLFDDSFTLDVGSIIDTLPKNAQILAVSSTFEGKVEQQISLVMKKPVRVQMEIGGPSLIGVEQYAVDVQDVYDFSPEDGQQTVKLEEITQLKLKSAMDILKLVPHGQAIIFTSYQLKAERIYDDLRRANLDVVLLSGALSQPLRFEAIRKFEEEKCDVLVATDLAARGLDYEQVNLVINYECPSDFASYIHRMGRSGRFGSFGRVFTLLGYNTDTDALSKFQTKAKLDITAINTVDDLKGMTAGPSLTYIDLSQKKKEKFFCNKRSGAGAPFTLAEAWDYVENATDQELVEVLTSCIVENIEDNIDPDALSKRLEELLKAHALSLAKTGNVDEESVTADGIEIVKDVAGIPSE